MILEISDMGNKAWWLDKWNVVKDWLTSTGIRFILALVVMFIAFKVINIIANSVYKKLNNKKADATLSRVLYNILRKGSKIIIFLMFLGYIGIETASLSALIASLGVGIGLAMQGALSNFAGGVLIILTRPFRIGDFIESQGQSGTVEDIHLVYTDIVTADNVVIKIPNGALANGVIVNKSLKDTRRVDTVFSISYEASIEKAEAVIEDVCRSKENIFKDPAPFVRVQSHGDSSINLVCRVWCKASDYWDVYFYLLKEVKLALDLNKIEIPYNKLDINLINSTNNEEK